MRMVASILFALLLPFCILADNRIENENLSVGTKTRSVPKSFDACKMDVQLMGNNESHGFVDILLPHFPRPLLVCFPQRQSSLEQTIILSHVACRQMGYMTVSAVHGINLPRKPRKNDKTSGMTSLHGLDPHAWTCRGHETAVGQCQWRHLTTEPCDSVLDVECGECQKWITDEFNGTIRSPGYPYAYLYNVRCKWKITIRNPNDDILLEMSQPVRTNGTTFACESCTPYIKVSYNYKKFLHVFDWFANPEVRNRSIPVYQVTIEYFSGLYYPKSEQQPRGFEITFKSYRPSKGSYNIWTYGYYAIGVGAFYFACGIIACIYALVTSYYGKSTSRSNQDDVESSASERQSESNDRPQSRSIPLRRGLRLRTPHSSELNKENIFIAVESTPLDLPPDYNDIVPTILRPPVEESESARSHPVYTVRANLCNRYSRNSNPQCGVVVENGQVASTEELPEDTQEKDYLKVQPMVDVKVAPVDGISPEPSVFLSCGDTPNYEKFKFEIDNNQLEHATGGQS